MLEEVSLVLPGLDMFGRGQVILLVGTLPQNGRMFSYKYHCLAASRSCGSILDRSSSETSIDWFPFSIQSCISGCSLVRNVVLNRLGNDGRM